MILLEKWVNVAKLVIFVCKRGHNPLRKKLQAVGLWKFGFVQWLEGADNQESSKTTDAEQRSLGAIKSRSFMRLLTVLYGSQRKRQ